VVNLPPLSICSFISSGTLAQQLSQALGSDRHTLQNFSDSADFFDFLGQKEQEIDCLLLELTPTLPQVTKRLHTSAILLPAVILSAEGTASTEPVTPEVTPVYHTAEVCVSITELSHEQIELAIAQFLKSATIYSWSSPTVLESEAEQALQLQQQHLSEKLKERLGYLGIYYKRDSNQFLRYLPEPEQQALLDELKSGYREIVLDYFSKETGINQKIDEFVAKNFFADVSVSQVLEIHMELMDTFSKQLKLEGRNEDILLDYRLTLIDVIAHLCEMYRRSIPREA
jgi:circadian clock protein KaiA